MARRVLLSFLTVALLAAGLAYSVTWQRGLRTLDARMRALGVEHVFQGNDDKLPVYEQLLARLGISPAHSVYVGDDLIDLPVMARAGLAIAVADAHPAVRAQAHWLTSSPGGHGAGRECCDLVLAAKQLLDGIVEAYRLGTAERQHAAASTHVPVEPAPNPPRSGH